MYKLFQQKIIYKHSDAKLLLGVGRYGFLKQNNDIFIPSNIPIPLSCNYRVTSVGSPSATEAPPSKYYLPRDKYWLGPTNNDDIHSRRNVFVHVLPPPAPHAPMHKKESSVSREISRRQCGAHSFFD